MKKYLIFSLFFSLIFFRIQAQDIPPKPNPPRLVNDFAKQLSAGEIAQLEQKLVAYNDSTSSQILLVIIPSTGDYAMADYALKIGREWGVGQKDKNNGIVLLWASTDRKIYIGVGDGMEGAIPDAIAKRIISTIITPDFKNGQYFQGLNRGIDAIFKYSTGEYKADASDNDGGGEGMSPLLIFIIIFGVIIFIIYRNKNGGGGGGRGFRNSGGPIFFPYSTFSGNGGSSGSWGGGGDSGGFGGFGGGSFSGGGAGGDY